VEVARLYTTRAKVAQTLRNTAQMKEELKLAAPLHATKSLDPNTFPPDTVALFEKVVAELAAQPLVPPGAVSLQDIARKTGLAWVVAGEVRSLGGSNGHRVALAVVDPQGAVKTLELTANPFDPNESFDAAIAKLFTDAGITRPAVSTVITPDPLFATTPVATATPLAVATARPVPSNALPRATPTPRVPLGQPWYKKQEPTGYSNSGEEWVNSAALLGRMNFALALAQNKVAGIHVAQERLAGKPDDIAKRLLFREPNPQTRAALDAASSPAHIAGLVLGGPEFQRR